MLRKYNSILLGIMLLLCSFVGALFISGSLFTPETTDSTYADEDPFSYVNYMTVSDWSNEYNYYVDGDEVWLTSPKHPDLYHYTIPARIAGKPVCGMEDIFAGNSYVRSINFAMDSSTYDFNIKYIGGYVFQNCNNLAVVTQDYIDDNGNIRSGIDLYGSHSEYEFAIPDSVLEIGDYAFYNCQKLGYHDSTLEFNSEIYLLGQYAFYNCNKISAIRFEKTELSCIEYYAFAECDKLESIYFSQYNPNLTQIKNYAFYWCNRLSSINLVNLPLTQINSYSFQGCTKVSYLLLPNTLETIFPEAFRSFDSLTELVIPNSVTYVGTSFLPMSIKQLTLPQEFYIVPGWGNDSNNVNYWYYNNTEQAQIIDTYHFSFKSMFGSWNWPEKVLSIDSLRFYNGSSSQYKLINGVLYSYDETQILLVTNAYNDSVFNISNDIEVIGSYAFYNNSDITQINFGENVSFVGSNAFENMSNLTTVYMNSNLHQIGSCAFYNCTNLVDVTLPSYLDMYYNLYQYSTSSYWDNGYVYYLYWYNDNVYCGRQMFDNCESLETVFIPSEWYFIPSHMFSNCTKLTTVTFSGNIDRIYDYAFYRCESLVNISSLSNVNYIDSCAFYYCKSLSNISELNNVSTIGWDAFSYCESLTTITFGSNLNELSSGFERYSALQNIYISSSNRYYTSISGVVYSNNNATLYHMPSGRTGSFVVPNHVTSIGENAFYSSNLTSVDWSEDNLTSIGYSAFFESKITGEISIGYNNLSEVGNTAFYACKNITKVTIGPNLEEIESSTFNECKNLRDLIFDTSNLRVINSHAFEGTHLGHVELPEGLVTVDSGFGSSWSSTTIEYLKIPTTLRYYTIDGDSRTPKIETLEFADGITRFNFDKQYPNDSWRWYFHQVSYTHTIFPASMLEIKHFQFEENTILEIKGSVTNGEREDILIPTECEFYGKICVPAEDYDLYYNNSAWREYRYLLTTSLDVTVTFENNIGPSFNDQIVEYGGTAVNPGTPQCDYEGAIFKGWYWQNPNTKNYELFSFDNNLYYDTTLTAKWGGIPADSFLIYEDNGDGTYTIVGYDDELLSFDEIVIPTFHPLTGGRITKVGDRAFEHVQIHDVIFMPNCGIEIGDYAFQTCKLIHNLDLSGVVKIGKNAFKDCNNFKTLTIPASVAYVGSNAFSGCVNLRSVIWESGENVLAGEAAGCYDVDGNKGINTDVASDYDHGGQWYDDYINGDYDFEYTTSLFEHIFVNCYRLESVVLPDNMYVIPTRMFQNCSALKSVTFSANSNLYRINNYAFIDCTSLTSITLPDNLNRIGNFAFQNCGLTTVTIPMNVETIGYNPFRGCANLERINVSSLNSDYRSINGALFYDNDALLAVPEKLIGKTLDLNDFLDSSTSEFNIRYFAFAGNKTIRSVTMPYVESLSIYSSAFEGCTNLSAVTFNSQNVSFSTNDWINNGKSLAFVDCKKLSVLIFNHALDQAPNYNNGMQIFSKAPNTISVYVVSASYDLMANSPWAAFNLIKYDNSSGDIFLVILDLNGGEGIGAVVVAENQVMKVDDPTKLGYVFAGWYLDEELTEKFNKGTPITENLFLYAKWDLLPYILTYYWNGGRADGIANLDEESNDVKYYITDIADEEYEPVEYKLVVPTRYGYTFVGWYMNETFTSSKYSSITIDDLTIRQLNGQAPMRMYARWEQITYNLTVQENEHYTIGLSLDSTNPVGHGSTISFTIIFKEGYTQNTPDNLTVTATELSTEESFELVAVNNEGIWYYSIEDVQSNYNVTISGVKINVYLVSFVSKPTVVNTVITGMPQSIRIEHGASIESILVNPLSEPTRLGYGFVGWYSQHYDSTTGDIIYDDFTYDFSDPVTEDLTISAAWEPIEYTITYHLNGGTLGGNPDTEIARDTYTIESEFLLPFNTDFTRNITRFAYNFGGWFDTYECDGDEITQVLQGTTGDLDFYAKWNAISYQIIYTTNDGIMATDNYPTSYTIEDTVILPQAVRGGHTFIGWNESADLHGNRVEVINEGTYGPKHFYAMWDANIQDINYYLNGNVYSPVSVAGVEINANSNYYNQKFTYDDEATVIELLSDIERTGYSFAGWYATADFSGERVSSLTSDTFSTDLYAKWTAIQYTLVFDYNDDERVIGDIPSPTPDLEITFTFDDFVTNNGSITRFNVSGGVFDITDDVEWDDHNIFAGWFTDPLVGTRYSAITPANVTGVTIRLYAHWATSVYNIYVLPGNNIELGEYQLNDLVRIVGGNGELDKVYGNSLSFIVIITNNAYSNSNVVVSYRIGTSGTIGYTTKSGDTYTVGSEIRDHLYLYINDLVVNTYSITFNSAGGTEVGTITNIRHGDTATAPAVVPTRQSYTFGNWYMQGTNNIMNWASPVVSNVTLYASWIPKTLYATFVNDVTNEVVVTDNPITFNVENYLSLDNSIVSQMPRMSGYAFSHFEINGIRVVDTQNCADDVTIRAMYDIVTYTISYTVDSGYIGSNNPTSYNINGVYYTDNEGNVHTAASYTLNGATKTNYTFTGWYYNTDTLVTAIPFEIDGQVVYDNIVLVANFTYTTSYYREVSFYDGTRLLDRKLVEAGSTVDPIETEEKLGYTNTGEWYKEPTFETLYDFYAAVNINTNLYIKYTLIDYTITYEYQVYDDSYHTYKTLTSTVGNTNDAHYNVESDILLSPCYAEGYTFTGWYLGNDSISSISYSNNGNIGNITLTGRFEYITYHILYSIEEGASNNTANKSSYKIDDGIITLHAAVPMRDYHFVKWVLTTNVNVSLESIDSTSAKDYYLTAVFAKNKEYVYITLYIGGVQYSEIQNEKGTLLTPPTRPRDGYILTTWLKEDGQPFDFATPTNENMSLYSSYELQTYQITYDSNMSIAASLYPQTNSYTIEDVVQIPNLNDLTGYRFAGWYIGATKVGGQYNFDNAIVFDGIIQNRTGDIDLVARFVQIVYTITYKLDGGTNSTKNPATFTYTTPSIVLDAPIKSGYTFTGWTRTTSNGEVEIISIDVGTHENIVLTANFVKNKDKINVSRSYLYNGVMYSMPNEVINLNASGKAFIAYTEPEREGYKFDGWYADDMFGTRFNLNIQYSDDQIMYGRMLPNEYNITYLYSVGGAQNPTNPTKFTYSSKPFVLAAPNEVPGYSFAGWYVGVTVEDDVFNFDDAVAITSTGDTAGDIEIVAKFDVVTYHVNYFLSVEGAENNPSNPTTFTVLDTDLVLFDAIAPEGYTFAGWFDAYDKRLTTIPEAYAGDFDVTAKFTQDNVEEVKDTKGILYILIGIAGVTIFFVSIIVVVVVQNSRRKAVDEKRIASLIKQINDVVNKK